MGDGGVGKVSLIRVCICLTEEIKRTVSKEDALAAQCAGLALEKG